MVKRSIYDIQTIQQYISLKIVLQYFKLRMHENRKSWEAFSFPSLSRSLYPLSPFLVPHHFHSQNSRREKQIENLVLLSLLLYSILDPRNQEAIKSFCFNFPSCSNSCSNFVCLKLCSFKSLPVCVYMCVCVYLQTYVCPCSFSQVILRNVFSFLRRFSHLCSKHIL